jgi:glc operon protein GlcG
MPYKENAPMRQSYHLSHADAMKLVDAVRKELEKDNRGAAVAVADEHGELIAFLRTDGCPLASINIAINKAFTASRERKESKTVGDSSRKDGFPMTNYGDLRYTAWGGGVPLVYQGVVVGGIGVSGLPEADDMVLARMAAGLIA